MGSRESYGQERGIGLELFYTTTPGIEGRLKVEVEDFVVDEISKFPEPNDSGRYTIAKITSVNWEMNRLVRVLGKGLGMSRNRIGFAGTKDKRAVTSQLLSFEAPLESVQRLDVHQVTIENAYRSKKHITIGDLIGNRFSIRLRDCRSAGEELQLTIEDTARQLDAIGGFPNFFGVQRFGSLRPVTHVVGRHIIKGELEKAVLAYVGNPIEAESQEAKEARRFAQESLDFEAALPLFPRALTFERMMVGYLARNAGDYAGAIGVLPPNLQMMFVHAYQSFIFNRVLCERIRRGIALHQPLAGDVVLPIDKDGLPDHDKHVPVTQANLDLVARQVKTGRAAISGPLFGSESVLAEGVPGEIERKVLEEEGVERCDFVVPPLAECNSTGNRREIVAWYKDWKLAVEGSDALVSFALGKGCYATTLLREFMKVDLIESDRAAYMAARQEEGGPVSQ